MEEKELRQLFQNQSDCYADTNEFDEYGRFKCEGEVIQAMTEDRFIEVLKMANLIGVPKVVGAIPYEAMSDFMKKSIDSIEDALDEPRDSHGDRTVNGYSGRETTWD